MQATACTAILTDHFNLSQAGLCSGVSCLPLQVVSSHTPKIVQEEHPDKLSLALEPDCAAVFCQHMAGHHYTLSSSTLSSSTSSLSTPSTPSPSTYLVVDIGGGTVDITAHRLTTSPQQHIDVVILPKGNDYGGSRVNQKFCVFLENLVRDKGFTRL